MLERIRNICQGSDRLLEMLRMGRSTYFISEMKIAKPFVVFLIEAGKKKKNSEIARVQEIENG